MKKIILVLVISLMMVGAVNATVYENALVKTSDFLVSYQDIDGWWHDKPTAVYGYKSWRATSNGILHLLASYRITGDPVHLASADSAGQALLGKFITSGSFDVTASGEYPGGSQRMNQISTILTAWIELYEITGNEAYRSAAISMGHWLLSSGARNLYVPHEDQAPGDWYGSFWWYVNEAGSVGNSHNLLCYGPEQIYGLASLYELTAESSYLDAAILGADVELRYQFGSSYATSDAVRGWFAAGIPAKTFTDGDWADIWTKFEGALPNVLTRHAETIEAPKWAANTPIEVDAHYGSTKILAYAELYEITDDNKYLYAVMNYADWAVNSGVQHADGYFYSHMEPATDSMVFEGTDLVRSTTWAAKALLEAYRITGNTDYLIAANKAVSWLLAEGHGYDSETGAVARYDESTDVYIAYSQTPFALTMAEAIESIPTIVYVDDDDETCGGNSPCFDKIQEGVDAVADGGTVNVADGTYDEQVVIDKSLTLQGSGDTTIIQPSGPGLMTTTSIPWFGGTGTMAAIVSVETTGDEVTIRDLKIDGSSITTTSTTWVAGLVYLETSGTIEDLTIIGYPDIGCRSVGIWASAMIETTLVEVTECTIIDQNRAGIYAYGPTITADYNNNVINGPGTHTGQVPNGFFFLEGAKGSATYNTITDMAYGGEIYRSSGIGTYRPGADLIFGHNEIYNVQNAFAIAGGSGATIEYNYVHDCHTGVKLEAIGENRASNVIIQYNDIMNNDFAIRGGSDMGDGNEAHYNNFVGNLGTEWFWDPDTWIGAVSNVHLTYILDATCNWWGDASGPGPEGSGDNVSDYVDYDPWLSNPWFLINKAKIEVLKGKASVKGKLAFNCGNGVDISDDVTVTVGPLSETITMEEKGKKDEKWQYKRPKDGEGNIKKMKIDWNKGKFEFRMDKAELTGVANPVTISVQIGDDVGSESILMRKKKHHWDYKAPK